VKHRFLRSAWLRWLVGLALLGLVVTQVDAGAIVAQIGRANLWLAIPAIGGLVAVHLLGARTWQILQLQMNGRATRWGILLRHYYIAQALGGITPANLGADAYRLHAASRGGEGWSAAARPIVMQRATSSVAVSLLGVCALALLPAGTGVVGWIVSGALVIGLGSAALIGLVQLRRGGAGTPDRGVMTGMARPVATGLALGLLFHVASLLLAFALVRSVSGQGEPAQIVAALAVARLSILIPFTPSGLGLQEGALAFLFVGLGLPAEVALAASVLNRMALLLTLATGGMLLLAGRPRVVDRSRAAEPGRMIG
jgi:glycosyltransferase 2 family protein